MTMVKSRITDPVADQLAAELGDLPLAVAQAAAYVHHTSLPMRAPQPDRVGADIGPRPSWAPRW
ncbi:MAG TPA: hypothetical protein VKP64_06130 [Mycobacteriales bacterium]|nr:hypothetical protein [Mycobacteriales bacterium]